MRIKLTADAIADIDALTDYLSTRSLQGMNRMLGAIFSSLGLLEDFPEIGIHGRVDGTRELPIPHTSLFVVYRVRETFIEIDRILDARMKYPPDDS